MRVVFGLGAIARLAGELDALRIERPLLVSTAGRAVAASGLRDQLGARLAGVCDLAALHVPADRSALDVIKDELPAVAYSCRQGFCGTCRTPVLDGKVERRSPSDADDGSMLICVSRAANGRLTLDV